MFAVVEVRHHRHNGTDETTLSHRRAAEDRDIGIACEVTRTADAVHHLRSGNVSRVDVTEDVGFEGSIHGDDTESAHHFGVI